MVLYSICDYNNVKSTATNTWAFMVLPGHVRACFFCGEICTYGRKELSCEEVSDMLAEQKMLCSTDIFHCTMHNMLNHCQGAYKQSTCDAGRVLACTACYNWIMHRRQTLPFITPVQILHWFFNTLSNTIPKKIDNRIISGVCDRLVRKEHNIPNYYYTLFSSHEQSTIQKIARYKEAGMLEGIVAQHFFQSCKESPIVLGCSISNFLRHNMKDDDPFCMNVYRAAEAM
jgi:hypothetical protein